MQVNCDTYGSEIRGHIRVRGQVQGVGFRPFVYCLATELCLSGWVRNDGEGVEIEIQGPGGAVAQLLKRLQTDTPQLARIDKLEYHSQPLKQGRRAFVIEESGAGRIATGVAPDATVCKDCLEELFDPANRCYRYAFINCTHCGPRYTITAKLPYDRPNTSMARFTQCGRCEAEYASPSNRRFHAQPNACPVCGPQLFLLDGSGNRIAGVDPVAAAVGRLLRGEIVAVKGLGGFHLACDARNAAAVARLRQRKQREEKPFAIMLAGHASVPRWAHCNVDERKALQSAERPIVLLRKTAECDAAMPDIAPGLAWLGVMLPYTPLQYLLFHEAAAERGAGAPLDERGCDHGADGRVATVSRNASANGPGTAQPGCRSDVSGRLAGTAWLDQPQELALVMTSANPGGEPLVTGNDEALRRLAGIADAYLMHDRDIVVRCDDSVVRMNGKFPAFIRRARGHTPRAIRLPHDGPSVLAAGGFFKNTFCLTRGNEAFVSQHIGDLGNGPTCEALGETVEHLMRVLEIRPERVAHDLHPDFFSTRFAAGFAEQHGIPAIAVQHHHAHVAAVAAEHRLTGAVLGLALDGVGLGSDGTAWGGELLRVDGPACDRIGHLKPLALPGGDRAAREPWRMGASALHALGREHEIELRFSHAAVATVRQMLAQNVNAPMTSSAGRLFDAAAGLLGVREVISFEGQAAMLLEGLADRHGKTAPMEGGFEMSEDGTLSLLPVLNRIADAKSKDEAAAVFHATFAQALAEWVLRASKLTGIHRVAFGGGCFLNHILSMTLREKLKARGLEVYEAQRVPPNDGGLSLGQAWVAMQANS